MSSSGGIGGGGQSNLSVAQASEAVNFGDAQVAANGQVSVKGVKVSLDTAEGAQALIGAVNSEDLAAIKALLQLKQVDSPDGPLLIPDDSFNKVDTTAIKAQLGPLSVKGGDGLDKEIAGLFEQNKIPNPFNANTTPDLEKKLKGDTTSEFTLSGASSGLQAYYKNPTTARLDGFVDYMKGIQAQNPHGNIMEILFLVFRDSIKETNEDKKYFLTKLKMFNDMGESLSNYLSDLVDVSRDLGAAAAGAKYPEMVLTAQPVQIKKFDLSTTNAAGQLEALTTKSKRLDRAGLNDTIKEVESMQETVRNKRQMASTAFQNFDQKANQLYNLMSSVMKAMNEMRMGTVRNML